MSRTASKRWAAIVTAAAAVVPVVGLAEALGVGAQETASTAHLHSAADIYQAACASCHGVDGRGTAAPIVGFDTPLPDFTDCSFATREPDADWTAVVHAGGPARAFDRMMPAFGEALPRGQIQRSLDHVRTFCRESAWPRGELNFPRPLVTEKAFVEDEAVVTTAIPTGGDGLVASRLVYERRFGARNQLEVIVPFTVRELETGSWSAGLGDVAVALKHALIASLAAGTIFSVAAEVILPTGDESEGFGSGTTVFEPFLALGQAISGDAFVHVQLGAGIPTDDDVAKEVFGRAAAGVSFVQGRWGRSWTPMVELLAARELQDGASTHWDVVPQLQVTLSRRQHIMLDVGVRVPVNDTAERRTQVLVYLLWDWFDGGLWQGW